MSATGLLGAKMNEPFKGSEQELDARARRIDLAHQGDFALGPVRVQPSLRTIAGDDANTMLEPKVMQVLVALADPIGAILSRDDLIERCWDGRVVGDTSINRVISLLRGALKEVAGDDVTIENVPKVGYRIIVSETARAAEPGAEPEPEQEIARPAEAVFSPKRRMKLIAAGLAALLAVIAGVYWLQPANEPAVEDVRIAMLPLNAADGVDPIYALGLEAELRAQFARVGSMEVTTSESAAQLMAGGMSAQDIGRKLGVQYVWSGTVSSEAASVGLTARMVRITDGAAVWEDEIFSAPGAAQYLPLRAARSLALALGRPVSQRTPERSVSASGYRLYLTAIGLIKGRGQEQGRAAFEILQQLTLDYPEFADGWAGLAKARFLMPGPDPSIEGGNRGEAKRLADYALTLDPNSVDALKVAGQLADDPEQGLQMLRRATQLDPGDAEAWFWLSIVERKSLLLDVDPLGSSLKMVAIDPLWPATWRTSDLAAEFGQVDTALRVEQDILSAAVTPSQRLMAEARLARLGGDFSRFVELNAQAAPLQTPAERRYGNMTQMRLIRAILGLPVDENLMMLQGPEREIALRLHGGELPSLAEFEAAGFGGGEYWDTRYIASLATPMFLREGRGEDLLTLYDARFAQHSDYLELAAATGVPERMIPEASSLIGAAMRDAGRTAEAAAHFASAEEQIARWNESGTTWIVALLMEIDVAAAKGENARAAALIQRLPDYNWPWIMGHSDAASIGLLGSNALHDEVRQMPEVRAVLGPIEAQIERERAEVLALGL